MYITNSILDSETKRRQALARVYSLLIKLAEEGLLQDQAENDLDTQKNQVNPMKQEHKDNGQ